MRRDDFFDEGGFAAPLRARERQRTALSLIASLALVLSIVVTVTVVSIGMAHAGILVATQRGDGSLAVVFLVICLVAGTIVGIYRSRHQQHPY